MYCGDNKKFNFSTLFYLPVTYKGTCIQYVHFKFFLDLFFVQQQSKFYITLYKIEHLHALFLSFPEMFSITWKNTSVDNMSYKSLA